MSRLALRPALRMAARGGARREVTPWYLAGGIAAANCIAAYTPKGAASLAASYDNNAAPGNGLADGTYDAAPGVAPTWAALTGWTFNGTDQYLDTGVADDSQQTWSVLVVFDNAQSDVNTVCGFFRDAGGTSSLLIQASNGSNKTYYYSGAQKSSNAAPWSSRHNLLALCAKQGYRNAVADGAAMAAGAGTNPLALFVGANNYNGGAVQFTSATISHVAIYNTDVAAQLDDIMTAIGMYRVVGFGDSITAGIGASDEDHYWLTLVADGIASPIVANAGISSTVLQNTVQNAVATIGGAADNNGRDTVAARVLTYTPTLVAILYGLNDLRLNDAAFSAANFQNDLGETVDVLTTGGVMASNIVIGSPPYIPVASYALDPPLWNAGSALKHAQYAAACAAVAAAKGTKYIDVYQWMIDNGGDALISGDGIHPNDAGHAAIANAFLSVI